MKAVNTGDAQPFALRWVMPGFGSLLFTAAFLGALLMGPRMMNIDGDLGRHITIGRFILENRTIPTTDFFSHTMTGQPVTPHEWLAQVIFALADAWMGLDGVVLVTALVIAASVWIVFNLVREAAGSLLPAVLVVMLALAASSLHWLTRPHIFTFLLLAVWLRLLVDLRAGKTSRWWLMPLVMLAWANLHGAFIAGFVTWGLFGIGFAWDAFWRGFPDGQGLPAGFWRSFFLGGLSSLAVTLINPSGPGLWATSTGYIGNRYLVGHTAEYLPPNFHDSSFLPFLVMIGLLVLVLGLQNRRSESAWVLLSSAWLVMSLYSARNIPLFAIVSAPLLAAALSNVWAECRARTRPIDRLYAMDQRLLKLDRSMRGWLMPLILVILAIAALSSGIRLDRAQQGNIFDPQVFPVEAVDWLEKNPQDGNVFNHFPWGGYLLYRQWPETLVFIDGQTDFYGESLTRQYEQVLTVSAGWEDVLEQYAVRWVIVPVGDRLANALGANPSWEAMYHDSTAVIFQKAARP